MKEGIALMSKVDSGHGAGEALLAVPGGPFRTILADPPWRFQNSTGKMAPEHKRLRRYPTLSNQDILELPVPQVASDKSHLYLWVPNALLPLGLEVMSRWGFQYKSNLIWYKVRKDGGPDRRGVGFYFRNVTEMLLFGVRGKGNRTGDAGRRQPNVVVSRKREHSRKPDEVYGIVETCSFGPYLEMFARHSRAGWSSWGNEVDSARSPYRRGYSSAKHSPETPSVVATSNDHPGDHRQHELKLRYM